MHWKKWARWTAALLSLAMLLLGCNDLTQATAVSTVAPLLTGPKKTESVAASPTTPDWPAALPVSTEQPAPQAAPTAFQPQPARSGEPAGCLSLNEMQQLKSTAKRLEYADRLLDLPHPLSSRILPAIWNPYTQSYFPYQNEVMSLSISDVQNEFYIQKMLNALHVAGFFAWLRNNPKQGLQILAIPMRGGDLEGSPWLPYARAYWQNSHSLPEGDSSVLAALKLPPCQWMIALGDAPQMDYQGWNAGPASPPDYVHPAEAYLASTNDAAIQVARQINWLGEDGREGPNTMCGPLAWSILKDAGVLPPGWGGWSEGPKAFWLARPRTNGRPWSLFPSYIYHLYSFREPLGKFDFSQFPLYPGDFLYTYSEGDGFDHMLVVTEVDEQGNVYTVTNKIQMVPHKQTTIERLLLLNLHDPAIGIARNQWANDRTNGRTGHAGFDVFRWMWVEKDIHRQPATYHVQPGDTLETISALWRTPAGQIARYNGVDEDAVLSVGQELEIPPND